MSTFFPFYSIYAVKATVDKINFILSVVSLTSDSSGGSVLPFPSADQENVTVLKTNSSFLSAQNGSGIWLTFISSYVAL